MFKKLLTLAAVAALGMTANAELVEDWYKDYTVDTWNYYVMGYIPSQEDGWLTVKQTYGSWERVDGEAVFTPNEDGSASWYQLFVGDGIPTQIGKDYTVTIYGKADVEAAANMNMQWGWGDGQQLSATVNFSTEWEEINVTYPEVGGSSCALVLQPGVQETVFEIKWIKVSHNENSKPIEWVELLEDGDAENGKAACAVAKIWEGSNDSEIAPCAIEAGDADHGFVFVAHATQKYENAWDNQFWIVAPDNWRAGDIYLLSFDYKASAPAKTSTQFHNDPGAYQHWAAIGDINFTTDWQTFSKQITIPSEADKGHSIAFNLNEIEAANDYYFDNISLKAMKLDEGWFVAYDFANLDQALELAWNEEQAIYEAYIAEEVESIKISTKRGNDAAFDGNCIKLAKGAEIEDGAWIGFDYGYSKIALPEKSDWSVQIDPETQEICFSKGDVTSTTAIAAIVNENAPAVYYNLQGVRVDNPSNGIYIVKKGNRVSKQVIR